MHASLTRSPLRLLPVVLIAAVTILAATSCLEDNRPWTLVFSREFNGPAGAQPDRATWHYSLGDYHFEQSITTDQPKNLGFDGQGNAVFTALKEPAKLQPGCQFGPCDISSARIETKGTFEWLYGAFEVRMKIPRGAGVWPAFWLVGANCDTVAWPDCGEMDVAEMIGFAPNLAVATVHGTDAGRIGVGGVHLSPTPLGDDFHVYRMEWQWDRIRWYVDGTQYFSIDRYTYPHPWVFDHPFHLILNLSIGGWPGDPNAETFPARMLVDYVRVYQQDVTANVSL